MSHRHALQALIAAIALSLVLYLLPMWIPALRWLAWPLLLFSTLFHELGHGVAALLAGGGFEALRIYPDGSGVATTLSDGSRTMLAAIAAGGPLGPPVMGFMLFLAARRPTSARWALWLLVGVLALAIPLWLRNLFGIGYVAVLALALAAIAWRASARAVQACVCFLAVQLSLAAFSRADYLFTAEARTGLGRMPSDTAQIANALWLPYWAWGTVLAAVSLGVLVLGVLLFAAALKAPPARSPTVP